MRVLNLGTLPIYLPYDKAPVPFGDVIPGITATIAAPGVFTFADTYTPTNGDAFAFTFPVGGSLPAPLTVTPNGTTTFGNPGIALAIYYVVGASGQTCNFAATKGGTGITTTTTGSTGATAFVGHQISGAVDGVTLPFKAGATVVAENNTGSSITLQAAPDTATPAPGQGYLPPAGPGTFVTIATVPAAGAVEVVLSNDWIKASATLVLQQN